MESPKFLKDSQIIILGIFIAVATIVSTIILSNSLIKIKKFSDEIVSVTGSAEKKIVSDYTTWIVSFSRRNTEMITTYNQLKNDLKIIKEYLSSKGIDEKEMTASQIYTDMYYKHDEKGNNTNEVEGYRLSQDIEVRSSDVEKVTIISRESTELINQGIELVSSSPQYFYTKLAELKIEMLKAATQDAKKRAEEIASSAGNKIGVVRSARMGVFQITPINSYEISDWGTNDTSSLEKKVTAVVKADFSIAQ